MVQKMHVHIMTDETSVSVNGNFKRNSRKRNTNKFVVAGYEKSRELFYCRELAAMMAMR
jgi:hypothetical protein